jgi:hypothetical protein
VRSLTNLTAKKVVPACLAAPFDSTHPLPEVLILTTQRVTLLFYFYLILPPMSLISCICLITGSSYPGFTSPASWRRAHCCQSCSCWPWSLQGSRKSRRGRSRRFSRGERVHSVTSPTEFEEQGAGKKRKRLEDLTSSGSSKPKDVPQDQSTSKKPPASLFNFLEADS